MKNRILRGVRVGILIFSVFAFYWGLVASAQRSRVDVEADIASDVARDHQRMADIDRRVAGLEQDHFDSRIARLEATGESNHTLLEGIVIGLMGLVVEAFFRIVNRARQKEAA